MAEQVSEKKTTNRISSPDELNEYLHVTNLRIWGLLIAAIFLLAATLVWSNFGVIESKVAGTATIKDGTITAYFEDAEKAESLSEGERVYFGGEKTQIRSITQEGDRYILEVDKALPEGIYSIAGVYESTKVIRFLLN